MTDISLKRDTLEKKIAKLEKHIKSHDIWRRFILGKVSDHKKRLEDLETEKRKEVRKTETWSKLHSLEKRIRKLEKESKRIKTERIGWLGGKEVGLCDRCKGDDAFNLMRLEIQDNFWLEVELCDECLEEIEEAKK